MLTCGREGKGPDKSECRGGGGKRWTLGKGGETKKKKQRRMEKIDISK